MLRQEANPAAHLVIAQRRTQQPGIPAGGRDEPEQHLDGGGLARTVGTQKTEHLTARDLQPQIVNRDMSPELLAQGASFDGNISHPDATGY